MRPVLGTYYQESACFAGRCSDRRETCVLLCYMQGEAKMGIYSFPADAPIVTSLHALKQSIGHPLAEQVGACHSPLSCGVEAPVCDASKVQTVSLGEGAGTLQFEAQFTGKHHKVRALLFRDSSKHRVACFKLLEAVDVRGGQLFVCVTS
eukprot:5941764-Amphidinium_carterae.1